MKLGTRYDEIAKYFADFAIRHYGPATPVVFDGYEEGPSIKDNTHQRRGRKMHPVVSFTAETEFSRQERIVLVKRHQQAETNPNDKRSTEGKILHCG